VNTEPMNRLVLLHSLQ